MQLVPTRNFSDTKSNGLINDAYISTDIIPKHTVYVGQMAVPVGREALLSPMGIDFVDYSQGSRKLLSNSVSTYYPYNHDVGAMITGDWAPVSYSVGTFNGTGLNAFDNNRRTSIAGQVTVRPLYMFPKIGTLELGSSMLHGSAMTSDLTQNYEQNILAFHGNYTYKKFNLKSEYMTKHGFINPGQVARAWNIDAKYNLTDKIALLARYDNFDPNLNPSLTDLASDINTSTEYVGGFSYAFTDNLSAIVNFVSVNNKFGKDSQRVGFLTQYLF